VTIRRGDYPGLDLGNYSYYLGQSLSGLIWLCGYLKCLWLALAIVICTVEWTVALAAEGSIFVGNRHAPVWNDFQAKLGSMSTSVGENIVVIDPPPNEKAVSSGDKFQNVSNWYVYDWCKDSRMRPNQRQFCFWAAGIVESGWQSPGPQTVIDVHQSLASRSVPAVFKHNSELHSMNSAWDSPVDTNRCLVLARCESNFFDVNIGPQLTSGRFFGVPHLSFIASVQCDCSDPHSDVGESQSDLILSPIRTINQLPC
jgi:hypothetical protein